MKALYKKKISIVGLGYIGLPTAALLASKGYKVFGTDVNINIVKKINKGEVHIVEPDLDSYVSKVVTTGKLKAYTEIKPADIYIICVPTPFKCIKGVRKPDLTFVKDATDSISKVIKNNDIVILESTCPVGATNIVENVFKDNNINTDNIYIGYCPERVLPGKIMTELVNNDRIIGGVNEISTQKIAEFYDSFVEGQILKTDAKTAEMCKLTENSYRDVNIAFANELSMICDKNGIDVWNLIKLANHHPRVDILQPGTGVGGHCIAVDPWFIVSEDSENSKIIKQAREVNDYKPEWVVNKILEKVNTINKKNIKIACLGLAFKPDVDDLRESPAINVVKALKQLQYEIICVEPNIKKHDEFCLVDLQYAIDNSDIIALLVGHKEFKSLTKKEFMESTIVIDFCGLLK